MHLKRPSINDTLHTAFSSLTSGYEWGEGTDHACQFFNFKLERFDTKQPIFDNLWEATFS